MINLREAVYYEYIDDIVVEIFNQYKWGLRKLGIEFSQEVLETIVYCPVNLESSLKAFCAWTLWKKEKGEKFTTEQLTNALIDALKESWIPTDFQENYLKKHPQLLESPQQFLWKEAEKILGYELRNQMLIDITDEGTLILRENMNLTSDERDKIEQLKAYRDQLFI